MASRWKSSVTRHDPRMFRNQATNSVTPVGVGSESRTPSPLKTRVLASTTVERYEIEQRLAREIGPQERVLWSGVPRQGLMLRASDLFLIPCGFAIFWKFGASRGGPFFTAWGIPFVALGLYIAIGRFFVDAFQRRRTIYAITNERVIIAGGGWRGTTVRSVSLRQLPEILLSERRDGRGTITLAPSPWTTGTGWPRDRQLPSPQLESIENARSVYELLRQAQKAA